MIERVSGNLLQARADALVNTVNTVGVMGKGIALQFKRAYPSMYEQYRADAKRGIIIPGRMHVWPTRNVSGPRFVINFPTKRHWKSPSHLEDIESGLVDLVRTVQELGVRSVAVPPLGCGNGGLEWGVVRPLIEHSFEELPEVEVLLYAPEKAPQAGQIATRTARPAMTPGRAALVEMIHAYTRQSYMSPGLIEVQKLMYFLQEDGHPLRLNYAAHHYGPYADNLRHVLSLLEGHYLLGYGDGSAKVGEAEPLRVLDGAVAQAEQVLSGTNFPQSIDRVLATAEGFESPYGLELLATTHWLVVRGQARSVADLEARVGAWSDRKRVLFTASDLAKAREHLSEHGWLPAA